MTQVKHQFTITLATSFTLLRIALTPLIVYLMVIKWWVAAIVCFICAAFTDAIDGFIARHYNQQTALGACLDPVADKILLLSVFLAVWILNIPVFPIPTWFIGLLFGKELLQVVGALLLYKQRGFVPIEANFFGKLTTIIQMFFISLLLIFVVRVDYFDENLSYYLCVFMSLLMILSFVHYSLIWIKRLGKKE